LFSFFNHTKERKGFENQIPGKSSRKSSNTDSSGAETMMDARFVVVIDRLASLQSGPGGKSETTE